MVSFVSTLVRSVVRKGLQVCQLLTNPMVLVLTVMTMVLFHEDLLGIWNQVVFRSINSDWERQFVVWATTQRDAWRNQTSVKEQRWLILSGVVTLLILNQLFIYLAKEVKVAIHNIQLETPEAEIKPEDQVLAQEPVVVVGTTMAKSPIAERMVKGSDLCNSVSPKFQVDVYVSRAGDPKLYYAGVAFRTQNRLVTAMHVVSDANEIVVKNPQTEVVLTISPEAFVETHVDVTWAELSDVDWSKLGTAAARLALTVPQQQWVQIIAQSKSTFGHLEEVDAMGMVKYTGSTISGFSGSPYHVNKLVYGIHVGAGTVDNFGFSASFLAALIRRYSKVGPVIHDEDSAEYLMGQFERFGMDSFQYEISPVDRDAYTIKVGGSYHNVDNEVFDRLLTRYNGRRTRGMQYEEECARADQQSFLEKRQNPEEPEPPMVPQELNQLPKVQELQPTFQGFAVFPETALASSSSTPGPVMDQKSVQLDALIKQNAQLLESLTQMNNSASVSPQRTRAQPRGPLVTTLESSTPPRPVARAPKLSNAQRWKAKYLALQAMTQPPCRVQDQGSVGQLPMPSTASRIGVVTSQAQVSPMNSLI